MGLLLELTTPEAKYIKDMSRDCHFAIDCACGGKGGKFSGSRYKNAGKDFEDELDRYEPIRLEAKFQHTFYSGEYLILDKLFSEHKESIGQKPLVIVCNDCDREFSFTHESYLELCNRLLYA